jgi:hypothetical protein
MALTTDSFKSLTPPAPTPQEQMASFAQGMQMLAQNMQVLFNRFREVEMRLDEATSAESNPVKAIVIIQSGEKAAQLECTFLNLPRVGDQLDLVIKGERRFVTVTAVRHPGSPSQPVIYAAEGETAHETLTVMRMGVASVISRLDEIGLKFEQALASIPKPGANIIAYLDPDRGPLRQEIPLTFIPRIDEHIAFGVDGVQHPLRVVSVVYPENGGRPTITLKPDGCHSEDA